MRNHRNRIILLTASFLSLILGVLIYSFLRSGTIYHSVIKKLGVSFPDHSSVQFPFCVFVRYYLTDMLWLFSLQSITLSIRLPQKRNAFIYSVGLLIFAVLYEAFQYFGILNGTGDFVDILMYIIATVSVVLLYNNLIISGGKE